MPGDTNALPAAFAAAVEETSPTHCLMLRQAPGRDRITLERQATNLRDFRTPDRRANQPHGQPVIEGAACAWRSTWPLQDALVAMLDASGISVAISEDAGSHLCNQLLYLAMHDAPARHLPYVGMFMHVPLLPEQIAGPYADFPSLPLPTLVQAVVRLLRTLDPEPSAATSR